MRRSISPGQITLGRLFLVMTWCALLAALLPLGPWRPFALVLIVSGMLCSIAALGTRWFLHIMGILGIALVGCILVEIFAPVLVADGRVELHLTIQVSDLDSDEPIPGARVLIFHPDILPTNNPARVIIDQQADTNGRLALVLSLSSTFKESCFRYWEGAGGIISFATIQVSADSYATSTFSIRDELDFPLPLSQLPLTRYWNAKIRSL